MTNEHLSKDKAVAHGNPFDGLTITGPFSDSEEAGDWALDHVRHETWWIVELEDPDAA